MADVAPLRGRAEFDATQALTGIGGLIGRVGTLQGALKGAGIALAALATKEAIDLIRKGVEAYKVQESAVNRLEAALSTAGAAGNEALDGLIERAGELQQITTKGDEAIIAATADLRLLAKELGADELGQAQEALIGIADVFLKGDLTNAASLLGKSLGSTTNALTRYGIVVDTSATQSEKLAQVMEQAAAFFEVSKAEVFTLEGAQKQLNNAWGDALELIGEIFVRITQAEGAYRGITEVVEDFSDFLEENRDEIVRWGRVVITVLSEALETSVRLFTIWRGLAQLNLPALIARGPDAVADIKAAAQAAFDQVTIGLRIVEAFNAEIEKADVTGAFADQLGDLDLATLRGIQESLAAALANGVEEGLSNADLAPFRNRMLLVSREIAQRVAGDGGGGDVEPIDTSGLKDLLEDVPILTTEARKVRDEFARMAPALGPVGDAIVDAVGRTEDWRDRVIELAKIWSDDAAKAVEGVVEQSKLNLEPVTATRDVVGDLVDQWDAAERAAEAHRRQVLETVRAVESVARGFLDVLQATGAIDRNLGSVLGSAINLGSSIAGIASAGTLTAALPLIGGALGAGANIFSGIFGGGGESPEERARRESIEENSLAVRRLILSVDRLANVFSNIAGETVEALKDLAAFEELRIAQEERDERPDPEETTIGGRPLNETLLEGLERARDEMDRLRLTFVDIEKSARAAGVEVDDFIAFITGVGEFDIREAAAEFNAWQEAVLAAVDATRTWGGLLNELRLEFELFDLDKPLQQLPKLLDLFFDFANLPAELEAQFRGADLTTAEGRAAFEDALREAFLASQDTDFSEFGRLTKEQFQEFLGSAKTLLERAQADDPLTDEIGGFRVDRSITLAEASRQTAFLSTIAITLSQLLRVAQEHLRVAGGTVPADTIDPGPAFASAIGTSVFDDTLAVLTDIRSILAAGLGNPLTGASTNVTVDLGELGTFVARGDGANPNIHVIDQQLGQLQRRQRFFTGAPRQVQTLR